MTIRPYQHSDYETICSWWKAAGGMHPLPGMMIEDGTFVVEIDGKPVMSQTVWLTQANIAWFEGFIKNPNVKIDKSVGYQLWQYLFKWAKDRGYKYVQTYSKEPRLTDHLVTFGMTQSLSGLTGLYKEL